MRSLLSLTLVTLAVVVIVARGTAGFAVRELPFACESSPLVTAEPSPVEGADPFGTGPWYVNADRTMWAGWDAGHWRVGRNKVLWIRPGRTLTITGTRIDADAPPLTVSRRFSRSYVNVRDPSLVRLPRASWLKVTPPTAVYWLSPLRS